MKRNMGNTDRIIRLVLAVLILIYAYIQSSWLALGCSLFTFYEASASWCVLYQLMGKNTCPLSKK
jgi:Protein of unknown function (DUF2892)